MTRYIKQNDKFSCGPVALINAAKWAGSEEKVETLREYFMSECECVFPGTELGSFKRTINKVKHFKIHSVCRQPSIGLLNYNLDAGRVAILRIKSEMGGHYSLCTRYTSKAYEVINWNSECEVVSEIPRSLMDRCLKHVDGENTSIGWFIEKNGD
jgi:hypothetical protein